MASRQRALGLCARRVLAPRVAAHGTYCEYDGEGGQVIPTMIVFGLVFGRWRKTTLAVGTLGWPLLLLANEVLSPPGDVACAAMFGFVNTLVGVAVHQSFLRLVRALRRRATPSTR